MRRRCASTISTGEIFLDRMLAVISAMVGKGDEAFMEELRDYVCARLRSSGKGCADQQP